jgi:hypothetical protein
MTTITISGGNVIVGVTTYFSLNYTAQNNGDIVTIHHITSERAVICEGLYDDITLTGMGVAPSATSFVATFNLMIGDMTTGDLPTDVAAIKSDTGNIATDTAYPNGIISGKLTPNAATPLLNEVKAGYVSFTTPDTNTGVIYIGASTVSNASYALGPDKTIYMELADLSAIYVKNSVGGEVVMVLGGYKL